MTPSLHYANNEHEYWQSNFIRYAGFNSSILVTAFLLLMLMTYVSFVAAMLWDKV